jgi:hypothetical protein
VDVRDVGNLPVANCEVSLHFDACPAFQICADCCDGVTIDPQNRAPSRHTNTNGVVTFSLRLGGVCGEQRMIVRAGGYLLSDGVLVASPDLDGNLLVDGADLVNVYLLIGSHETRADFDGDGEVTQADYDWMRDLRGAHTCSGPVPEQTPSWGVLKLIYR